MANLNAAAGLSPDQYLNGSPWNGQARRYYIPSTDVNAYAIGDPVDLVGGADATAACPTVTLATAGTGNPLVGVIVSAGGLQVGGPSADPSNLNTTVIPATKTKNYFVMVADDPNILFSIQEGGAGAALTAANAVGKNFNLVAGANSGYLSGWQLDNASTAVTNTLQVKVLGLVPDPSNSLGKYAKWLVKINNHRYAAGTTSL